MTGIKCSVVVPISQARNKRDTLGYWLGSQEAKHFEIILVHDLADGQTNEKYESYIQEFSASTIILLSGNFGNPGEARNLGLSYASAKWVVFWDSDDLPDLKCQMIALEKADAEQAEIVISDFRTVSDSPVQSEKIFRLDAQTN